MSVCGVSNAGVGCCLPSELSSCSSCDMSATSSHPSSPPHLTQSKMANGFFGTSTSVEKSRSSSNSSSSSRSCSSSRSSFTPLTSANVRGLQHHLRGLHARVLQQQTEHEDPLAALMSEISSIEEAVLKVCTSSHMAARLQASALHSSSSKMISSEMEGEQGFLHLFGRCFNLSLNLKILNQGEVLDPAIAHRVLLDLQVIRAEALDLCNHDSRSSLQEQAFSQLSLN